MKSKKKSKIKSVYALLLSVSLLTVLSAGGCVTKEQPQTGTCEEESSEGSTAADTDRIVLLERRLETLYAEQEKRNDAYEARIRALERSLSDSPTSADSAVFTYEDNGHGVTLTGWNGSATVLTIPQTIDGKTVTAIGDGAFRDRELERVTLPDGVKTVGWFAFSGCYRLVSVSLPASIESIGYGAFERCSATMRVICPSGSYAAKYAASYGIPTSAQ